MSGLWTRLMLMLARSVVDAVASDEGLQTIALTLLADEDKNGFEHFEGYGYTSSPPPGLEAVAAFIGGDRSHGIVVAVGDRKFRLKGLEAGEVALYTDEGDYIHFRRGRKIAALAGTEIAATAPVVRLIAAEKVRAETPLLECTGEIVDFCDLPQGRSMSAMRDVYDGHNHNEHDGPPTATPNQLMGG